MAVLQIRKAQREGSRLVFAFAGWTGKGKTYTALQFAYGLAGYDATKVGFIDAENRRGSLLADCLEKSTRPTQERFLIGDLYAPFSPARYSAAIDDFEAANIEVLIIDSVTHEWEGTGGVQEIVEAGNPKIPRWDLGKEQHKKFMNKLLQSNAHIICCVRAREKTKPEKDKSTGKTVFVDYGLQPIQEKNFMFEVTASLMMFDEGKRQDIIKCPDALINYLGRRQGYITSDDGFAVRNWVNGALKLDPAVEKYRNRLISNTEGGIAHIQGCWDLTPAAIQEALGKPFLETLKQSAKAYEEHQKIAEQGQGTDEDNGGGAPAGAGNATEQAAADAIAEKARAAAATAPNPQPIVPKDNPAPSSRESPKETAAATPSSATPVAAASSTPAPTPEKPKEQPKTPVQQQLVAPVTGVLPGDPVF